MLDPPITAGMAIRIVLLWPEVYHCTHKTRFHTSCHEKLNVLILRERSVAVHQRKEAIDVILHHANAPQRHEFAKGGIYHCWAKTGVHQLDKSPPGWGAGVELKLVIP